MNRKRRRNPGPEATEPPPLLPLPITAEEIIQEKVLSIFQESAEARRLIAALVKKGDQIGDKAREKEKLKHAKGLKKDKITRYRKTLE